MTKNTARRPVLYSTGFFLAILFLLPVQLGWHFWPTWSFVYGLKVDYLSPTLYLTDVLVLCFILFSLFEKRVRLPQVYHPLWFLFAYLITNSLLVAQNQLGALYKFFKITEMATFSFVLSKSLDDQKVGMIKRYLSFSITTISLVAVFQFIKQSSLGGFFWLLGERLFSVNTPAISTFSLNGLELLRPYSIFSHPNSFAGFLLIGLVLLYPWNNKLTKVSVTLGILAIFLSWSQVVWGALIFFVLWILLKKYHKESLSTLKELILVFVVLITFLPLFLDKISIDQGFYIRVKLSNIAFKTFSEFALTGVGLNNFFYYLPSSFPGLQVAYLQPVHNIFLLWLVETGLVGFLFGLWLFVKLYVNKSFSLVFVLILLTGAFDHYWLTLQQNMLLASLVLSLTLRPKGADDML